MNQTKVSGKVSCYNGECSGMSSAISKKYREAKVGNVGVEILQIFPRDQFIKQLWNNYKIFLTTKNYDICATEGCSAIVTDKIYSCDSCLICNETISNVKIHQIDRCNKLKEEQLGKSVEWIKENSKPCPACNRSIERWTGCNHMRCSECQYYFCWICLEEVLRYQCESYHCRRPSQ